MHGHDVMKYGNKKKIHDMIKRKWNGLIKLSRCVDKHIIKIQTMKWARVNNFRYYQPNNKQQTFLVFKTHFFRVYIHVECDWFDDKENDWLWWFELIEIFQLMSTETVCFGAIEHFAIIILIITNCNSPNLVGVTILIL